MEEVTKETGHRPSVSMPSLDAIDDFTSDATAADNSDSVFVTTDSFVSTASTETVTLSESSPVSTTEVIPTSSADTISVETTEESVGELSTATLIEEATRESLIEEASRESLIEEDPTASFVGGESSEVLIEAASTEELIETEHTDTEALIDTENLINTETEVLQQEGLDESQVEEDPSIAIDQFIKKIADEQLSSKRIEERKEEEAQEQENDQDMNLEENKEDTIDNLTQETVDESTAVLEEIITTNEVDAVETSALETSALETSALETSTLKTSALETSTFETPTLEGSALETSALEEQNTTDINPEPSSLENTLGDEPAPLEEAQDLLPVGDKPEPMEVDAEIHSAPTQKFDLLEEKMSEKTATVTLDEDEHMAESIEEIQKEIDRIPPKKKPSNGEESSKTTDPPTPQNNEKASPPLTNSNGDSHMEESIEQILGGKPTESDIGAILKTALEKQPKAPSIEESADVAKDSNLIEKAQEEIKKMDVLVCGECHSTFYFVQDFTEHKNRKCSKITQLTCESENKPQVWGFILWKTKQTKDLGDNVPSSWSIYQRWCKLPQADKNAWITAGQSIQFASKIGNAKVTEIRSSKPKQTTTFAVQKIPESAPPPLEFVDSNKENSSGIHFENTTTNIIKKGLTKPVKLNNDVTIMPSTKNASSTNSDVVPNLNTAVRTTKVVSMQKDEFVVEKIMAKRFNPRKKTWEYNIKWENFGHDSNTWEPISNLSHCKKLLEQFEEQLRRMKEEKAKQAQSPKGRGRPSNPKPVRTSSSSFVPIAPKSIATISNVVGGVSEDYAGGSSNRPQRSSKQKAMNQVKQWCGSISDDDAAGSRGGNAIKRRHETDDSDEDFDGKRIKLEEDSDYSDTEKEIKPKISIKKVTATPNKPSPAPQKTIPVKNGNTTQQVLPSNILIPDANGVVRINQKQLPALSSGVYIMSKTAGIIKLDSTTSKVATSGGQTIVKVAPKIGQTQIKIVKKDGQTTKQIIQVSPRTTITSTPVKIAPGPLKSSTPKITPKMRKEVRKPPPLTEPTSKFVPKKIEVAPPKKPDPDSDSDDGLEPLPFPDLDEPLPDLEEDKQEDEFMLDPLTGKIAGMDYTDKPVIIKEEPQAGPPTTNELENIVKLAAAELAEEDLQNSDQDEYIPMKKLIKPAPPQIKVEPQKIPELSPSPAVRKIVKYTLGPQGARVSTESSSILSKTLTQAQPKQVASSAVKPAITLQNRVQQKQKVINQMVTQRTPVQQQARTVVRHVIEPSRPGQGGNINVIRKTVTPGPKQKFNLTPQKPLPSPLQPTRTYSAMGGIRQSMSGSGTPGQKVHVYSAKTNVSASQTTGQMQTVRRIGNTVVRPSGQQSNMAPRQQQQQVVQQQHPGQKQQMARIVQRVVASPKKQQVTHQQVLNHNAAQLMRAVKPVSPVKAKTVISMPSLTGMDMPNYEDDTPLSPPKLQQKPVVVAAPTPPVLQRAAPKLAAPKLAAPKLAAPKLAAPKLAAPKLAAPVVKQEPVQMKIEVPAVADAAAEETTMQVEASDSGADQTDWSSFTMADGENPIYVTGDDGTIYQVAGQNEQGQTILITQGADGQQQCLLVTNEIGEMAPDEPQPSTSAAGVAVAEPEQESESAAVVDAAENEMAVPTTMETAVDESLQTPLHIKTDAVEMEAMEDGVQDQVVAQVVRAEPPSPGGTHKVVVMLPDGNLMVTQVSPEEYASLELE